MNKILLYSDIELTENELNELKEKLAYLSSPMCKACTSFLNTLYAEGNEETVRRNRKTLSKQIQDYHKLPIGDPNKQRVADWVKAYGAFLKKYGKPAHIEYFNNLCRLYMHDNKILPDAKMIAQHQHLTLRGLYAQVTAATDNLLSLVMGIDGVLVPSADKEVEV